MAKDSLRDTDEFMLPPHALETLERHSASAQVQVDLSGMSHRGLVRPRNEDTFLMVRGDRGLTVLATNLPKEIMPPRFDVLGFGMLVADGMGGMSAGDVASRMAAQTLIALVVNTPDWIMLTGEQQNETILARMAERYQKVDATIRDEAAVDPKLTGMGTTMTVAYSLGTDLFLGHVGDSRAYLLRDGRLRRLTHDHTIAQALADLGAIPPHTVVTHHFRHALTRYLGGQKPVKTDVQHARLEDGDQVLLCTDGLTGMVDDDAIAVILREAKTADAACQALIDAALKKGGKDNVTVALARYRFPTEAEKARPTNVPDFTG